MLFHIECYSCILATSYLTPPYTDSTHFSNVVSFSHLKYYIWILAFFYLTKKHSKYLFWIILFLHVFFFFSCDLAFRYVRKSKIMKTHVYGKVVLFFFIGCFPCFLGFLVPSTPINIQKALFYRLVPNILKKKTPFLRMSSSNPG